MILPFLSVSFRFKSIYIYVSIGSNFIGSNAFCIYLNFLIAASECVVDWFASKMFSCCTLNSSHNRFVVKTVEWKRLLSKYTFWSVVDSSFVYRNKISFHINDSSDSILHVNCIFPIKLKAFTFMLLKRNIFFFFLW